MDGQAMSIEHFIAVQKTTGPEEDGALHHTIDPTLVIPADEYEELRTAAARIAEWARGSLHRLVYANQEAVHDALSRLEHGLGRVRGFDLPRTTFELQVALANWLSSVRWLLDHTRVRFGDEPSRLDKFKAAMTQEFDQNSAYRLSYKLRDFSTHRDLPPISVSGQARLLPDGTQEVALSVRFEPAKLLESWDGWGRFVTADLANAHNAIDVVAFVDDAMASIERIMAAILVQDAERYRSAAGLVIDAIGRLPAAPLEEGGVPMLVTLDIEDGRTRHMTPTPLPADEASDLIDLLDGT